MRRLWKEPRTLRGRDQSKALQWPLNMASGGDGHDRTAVGVSASEGAADAQGERDRSGAPPCAHSLPRPSMAAATLPLNIHVFGNSLSLLRCAGCFVPMMENGRIHSVLKDQRLSSNEATCLPPAKDVVSWG